MSRRFRTSHIISSTYTSSTLANDPWFIPDWYPIHPWLISDWLLELAPKDSEKDEEESSGPGDEGKKPDSEAANIVEDALQLKLDEELNEYRDVRSNHTRNHSRNHTRVDHFSNGNFTTNSIQDREMEEELNHEADDQEEEDGKGKI